MASDEKFLTFVCDQLRGAGGISYRKMFGEYALYKDQKVVALVCDNQLFVKPTPGGKTLLGRPHEAPPYPGAKPCFLISDSLDDPGLLSELIATTARELPSPKPAKTKSRRKAVKKRAR